MYVSARYTDYLHLNAIYVRQSMSERLSGSVFQSVGPATETAEGSEAVT